VSRSSDGELSSSAGTQADRSSMIAWTDDHHFSCKGVSFSTRWEASTDDQLVTVKERSLIDRWAELVPTYRGGRLVELGIFQGGSTALLALLADPAKLLAIEYSPHRVRPLDRLLEARGMTDSVVTRYGVDQADGERLSEVVAEVMEGEPLDLVIDDASHDYHATVASFEVLFPKLRPGGLYLIEDWCWPERASTPESEDPEELFSDLQPVIDMMQARLEEVRKGVPLHRMAVELVLARASVQAVLGRVTATPWWLIIERGEAPVADPFTYDDLLRDHFELLRPRNPAG